MEPVAILPQHPIPPPTALTERYLYRSEPTADVTSAVEYRRWELAEFETDLASATDATDIAILQSTIAFVTFHLSEAVSELERRQRLRNHPAAPAWPATYKTSLPDAQLIKDRLNIVDYFRLLGMEPRRHGRGWVAPCDLPSHPGKDDNPSLRITESGRGWYCHVCNVGGDLLTLHCARTGLRFVEALWELASEARTMATEEVGRVR